MFKGSPRKSDTCSHSSCAYIVVAGLTPGSHSVTFHSSRFGLLYGGAKYFNGTQYQYGWYGYPGDRVWAVVDGVRTPDMVWN